MWLNTDSFRRTMTDFILSMSNASSPEPIFFKTTNSRSLMSDNFSKGTLLNSMEKDVVLFLIWDEDT